MIYLESEKSNVLFAIDYPDFQSYYNACLESWDLRFISCSGCEENILMRKNGFYRRRIETERGTESVRIQRMRCPCCGHSDALFPVDIVPYSPIMAEEHVAIIEIYLESFHAESFFHRISVISEACEEVLSLSSLPDFPTIYKLVKRYEAVWAAYAVHLHPLSVLCQFYTTPYLAYIQLFTILSHYNVPITLLQNKQEVQNGQYF